MATSYEVANPDSLTEWEVAFQPAAWRYRKRQQLFIVMMLLGIAVVFVSLFWPEPVIPWIAGPGVALIFAAMVVAFTLPRLTCPHCRQDLEKLDQFCPRCSAASVEPRPWRGNRCGHCGKGLGSYKGRQYRIRYCTHCGVLVDRIGV